MHTRALDVLTRFSFHAAPACTLAYGVVRLFDGLDGTHGPGLAWNVGHVFFLACLLLFGAVIVGLYRRVPSRRPLAAVATVIGLAGLVAFVRIAVVDIVVGLGAADPAEKRELAREYADLPHVLPRVFYELGPVLFELGLITLLVLLALGRPQRLSWWALSLIALGLVAITVDLDLLPAGAVLAWLGLASIARRPGPVGSEAAPAGLPSASPATSG